MDEDILEEVNMQRRLGRILSSCLMLLLILGTTAAAPQPLPAPRVTIELVNALPEVLNLGDSYTVEIRISSDVEYLSVFAMPAPQFPGRYVVIDKPDHAGSGTSATLYITFTAKNNTSLDFPDGVHLSFVVAARFKGGITVSEWYNLNVIVP
jgi:hypothetical protein